MSEIRICPICGGEVPSDTGICPVCKADLNTLPPELFAAVPAPIDAARIERSEPDETEDASKAVENKEPSPDSPIPDWMRKRLQNQPAASQERAKVDFQSYEDMLFNNESHSVQPKSAGRFVKQASGKAIARDLDPARIMDDTDTTEISGYPESTLIDFSIHRPNRKWDSGSIERKAPAKSNNRDIYAGLDPAQIIEDQQNDSSADNAGYSEDTLVDFSIHRPNRKWDSGSIERKAHSGNNSRDIYAGLDPALVIEDQQNESSANNAGYPEDTLVDFSIHRPNRKWDGGTQRGIARNDSGANSREIFSHFHGSDHTILEGIEAPLIETDLDLEDKTPTPYDPALEHCVAPGKADRGRSSHPENIRSNRKQRKRKPAAPILPEQAIKKEEQAAQNSARNEQDTLVPESGTLISDLMERINQNSTSAPETGIPELADLPILTEVFPSKSSANNTAALTNNSNESGSSALDNLLQQAGYNIDKITGPHQQAPVPGGSPAQTPAAQRNEEAKPGSDTEIPWNSFGTSEIPAQPLPEQPAEVENTVPGPLPAEGKQENPGTKFYSQDIADTSLGKLIRSEQNEITLENSGNNTAEVLNQVLQQIGYHVETPVNNAENIISASEETGVIPQVQTIPTIEEPSVQEEDEIPWDLFGTGDMPMPQAPADPAYRTFSRSGIPSVGGANAYQRKMMSSVLERIIQSENEVPQRKKSTERQLPISARLFWALLAIAGVLFILLSGITDSLIITRTPMTDKSQDFVQSVQEAQGEVLVVIDYTPAYVSILDAPLQKLTHRLQSNGCSLRFCVMNSVVIPNAHTQLEKVKVKDNLEWWPAGAISIRAHLDAGDVPENIYLITADAASVQTWGEQLRAAGGSRMLHVMAPEQLEPVLVAWLNAGIVSSAIFRDNDYETLTDGTQLHKLGRNNYAIFYLILLLLLSWPCGILMEFIRNDSHSAERTEPVSDSPSNRLNRSDRNKGGTALEQQL